MKHAQFVILRSLSVPGLDVYIRDIGPWDEHPTVTNDAENVVERLVTTGKLTPGKRLFYEDSDGNKDEILVEDGKFLGFAFIGKKEKGD